MVCFHEFVLLYHGTIWLLNNQVNGFFFMCLWIVVSWNCCVNNHA